MWSKMNYGSQEGRHGETGETSRGRRGQISADEGSRHGNNQQQIFHHHGQKACGMSRE